MAVVTSRPPPKSHLHAARTRTSQLPAARARAISGDERPTRSISHREVYNPGFGGRPDRERTRTAHAPAAARRARPAPTHHHAWLRAGTVTLAAGLAVGRMSSPRARASGAPQAAAGRSCPGQPDVFRRRCTTARGHTAGAAAVAVARVPAVYPIRTRVALGFSWVAMATCRWPGRPLLFRPVAICRHSSQKLAIAC